MGVATPRLKTTALDHVVDFRGLATGFAKKLPGLIFYVPANTADHVLQMCSGVDPEVFWGDEFDVKSAYFTVFQD